MSETDPRFEGDDPIAIFSRWLEEAALTEPSDPNAIALATVDGAGLPNVRIVLLKAVVSDGFVFYTNYESAKGEELTLNPRAAFVCHWKTLGRQVRVRGDVARDDGEAADRYFASRPLDSRLGAWASRQSRPLASRGDLQAEVERVRREQGTEPKRPPHWGGFRMTPSEIELWAEGEYRLHDRFRYMRHAPGDSWSRSRLNP